MPDQSTQHAATLEPALQLLEEAVDLVVSGQVGHAAINTAAIQTLREVLSYVADDGRDVSRITFAVAVEGEGGNNHTDVLVALTPPGYEGDRDALFAPDAFIREPSEVTASPPEPSLPTIPPESPLPSEVEVAAEDSTDPENEAISEPCRTASNLEKLTARPRYCAHFGCGQYLGNPSSDSKPSPTAPALRNDLFYITPDGLVDTLRHESPFYYTNESRVDRSVWLDVDPRRQYTAEVYVCNVCYREQSEELDAAKSGIYCQCLSSLFLSSDCSVEIIEIGPSTLGVRALQAFSGGSIIAEFAGLITFGKSIEECPRALTVCRGQVRYQVSQDSEGNWTKYLRYTTCECSNVELGFVTWKGTERVVVKVRDCCSVGRGDELMLSYV